MLLIKGWVPTYQKPTYAPRSHLFGRKGHQMDQKGQYLAQNGQKSQFWTKLPYFFKFIVMHANIPQCTIAIYASLQ